MISLFILNILLFLLCFNCQLHNQSLHHHHHHHRHHPSDSIDYYRLWTIWKLHYYQYYINNNNNNNNINDFNNFTLWKINIHQILLHNLLYDLKLKSYRKSINQYTIMNWNDFYKNKKKLLHNHHHHHHQYNRLLFKDKYKNVNIINTNTTTTTTNSNNNSNLPDTIDWRENDTVTPVKTQDNCASSWAIASVEALEGQVKRKTGILTPLSSQQLIDCTGDHECVENPVSVAFDFIKEYGVESEKDYPFTGNVGNCSYNSSRNMTTLSSYVQVNDNEMDLQKAVYNIGPIAVRITMTQEFLTYGSGILLIDNCQDEEPFETVLLIGYGIENKIPYWLIKFSLSEQFGDHGYMKLARNYNNMCHITNFAYYPVI
ncbi:unnamed protein product [Schistosoma spindalis]|nr:unnamed protein product [Schistosoma spindale]